MTQEEKAKAYDEALERAKVAYKDEDRHFKATLERIFPELQERENSENKRISKEITQFLKQNNGWNKEWLNWLEKQGKQEPYGQRKECSNCQFNYAGECKGFCQMKRDEQEPADKVEPEFKVEKDKWYVCTSQYCNCIEGRNYKASLDGRIIDDYGTEYDMPIDAYRWFRPWTIADAKDGDVVVDKSDGTIGIFQSIGHHPDGGSYNDHSYCFLYCRYDDGFFYADFEHGNTIDSDDLIPATKEQRYLLFQKMVEAGYGWDTEKKELKKIEPKTLDADKVIEWLRQNVCTACWDDPNEAISQYIERFKKDFGLW